MVILLRLHIIFETRFLGMRLERVCRLNNAKYRFLHVLALWNHYDSFVSKSVYTS